MSTITPMMQQYLEIKAKYPDGLLLYRMGDFYELFMEDAATASRILDIALTSRDRNAESPVPMCGVPYHSAEGYLAKLVAAGFKVAVCDQVEDPKKAKGLVRREVTRVITPGLVLDSQNLSAKQPNYLAAVSASARHSAFGLACLDISTADFRVTELGSEESLIEELLRISPRELLLPEGDGPEWLDAVKLRLDVAVTRIDPVQFDRRRAQERLTAHFGVHSLEGFGVGSMGPGVEAAGAILAYLQANLFGACGHVTRLLPYSRSDFMVLDEATVRNLEIFYSSSFQGRKGSLLDAIDRTRTAMGGRRLQQWLRYPLLETGAIVRRQSAIGELAERAGPRQAILAALEKMNDVERINGRIGAGVAGPRDLVALKRSLQLLPALGDAIAECTSPLLHELSAGWDPVADVAARIESALADPPPPSLAAGGAICPGFSSELDHFVRLSRDAKGWMAEYETQQRRETAISSLKVRYNKVFGYYIEVSKANIGAVPLSYHRKQTLVNAERYITEDLKEFETMVLEADEKRLELEQQLFTELRGEVALESGRIGDMAEKAALLDCLASLSELATIHDYCCPELHAGGSISIRDGRHPVVERFVQDGAFVPNDTDLDNEDQQVLIITGPNMAGKSTILRQVALIVLLAQTGSFVPASEARLGTVDRIFTRVGASDDLARGRSTFMVEMQETANILYQATSRSLVVLDEIGRGTSTFDGLSIAWAVAEYLHDLHGTGVKTLFATHYHELTELARTRPRVKNFNVAIREWRQEILFFHKLVPGGTSKSYGIQVARLAGLPQEITARAREILTQMEGGQAAGTAAGPPPKMKQPRSAKEKEAGLQLSLFRPPSDWVRDQIVALDLDGMSPIAALQTLFALKEQIEGGAGKPDRDRAALPAPAGKK